MLPYKNFRFLELLYVVIKYIIRCKKLPTKSKFTAKNNKNNTFEKIIFNTSIISTLNSLNSDLKATNKHDIG